MTTPRLRILVVDDNRSSADALARLLKKHGDTVEAVYDGVKTADLMGSAQTTEYTNEVIRRVRSGPFGRCRRRVLSPSSLGGSQFRHRRRHGRPGPSGSGKSSDLTDFAACGSQPSPTTRSGR